MSGRVNTALSASGADIGRIFEVRAGLCCIFHAIGLNASCMSQLGAFLAMPNATCPGQLIPLVDPGRSRGARPLITIAEVKRSGIL